MKTCTNCKVEYPLDNFYKRKLSKDGHGYLCKDCNRIKCAEYIKANPKKEASYRKKQYDKDPEKAKKRFTAWRSKNRDKARASNSLWIKNNPEKYKECMAANNKKITNSLPEWFMRKYFFGKDKTIPVELINLKRVQIQINRELKQMEKQV